MLVRYAVLGPLDLGVREPAPAKPSRRGVWRTATISTASSRVASQVALPELEPFRTPAPDARADDQRAPGQCGAGARSGSRLPTDATHVRYNEGLGILGFGIDVLLGRNHRRAGHADPEYSPHVLYTNVVEPILRWTFVRKGYALVHGACLAFGDDAYPGDGPTDTGKTTTMLRILAEATPGSDKPGAFISDDLTLVSPDGRVLTYPKPMTISHHTGQGGQPTAP